MAIKITPLTDTQVKAFKPLDKDKKYFDGGGLFLLVRATGSKLWRFKYKRPLTNKEALLSFGSYPKVSLQQARKLRDDARDLIKKEIDPQEYKNNLAKQNEEKRSHTFRNITNDWLSIKSNIKPRTAQRIKRSIENHLFPKLGDKIIHDLKAMDFISTLKPIKELGVIKTLCQRINEVMNYCVNIGLIEFNPCLKINSAFESPTIKRFSTIKPDELPEFMKALSVASVELQTRCVIKWQLLTMTRPSEASSAKWEDIDLDNKLWIIPAERMKMKREHIIPLSKQAINILNLMKTISGSREYVFTKMKPPYNQPMNSQTANTAIKRMGYKDRLVAHGLRALASTILNEQGFNYDVIESALAHVDKNAVRRAYNRATYLEPRKIMLDWWGDFIEQASNGNISLSGTSSFKVVNI